MITTRKISKNSIDFQKVKNLYRTAFPKEERVPIKNLLDTTQSELLAYYDRQTFCGFCSLLSLGDITHILFFAISKSLRGKGYGSAILNQISKTHADQRIILDIEAVDPKAPNYAQRVRRKAFYLKNGYREADIRYRWHNVSYEILVKNGTICRREWAAFWDYFDKAGQKGW